MNELEKIFYTALIGLSIFTFGVQIGICNGRHLQKIENFRIQRMQEYLFRHRCGVL